MKRQIKLYTDGGNSTKLGFGGWGVVVLPPDGPPVKLSGHFPKATNNQMELYAAIEGLHHVCVAEAADLASVEVEIVTDSEYLRNGMTDWIPTWIRRNWRTTTGPVKNRPLWESLLELTAAVNTRFSWVRGHTGDRYNEMADELATAAYTKASRA